MKNKILCIIIFGLFLLVSLNIVSAEREELKGQEEVIESDINKVNPKVGDPSFEGCGSYRGIILNYETEPCWDGKGTKYTIIPLYVIRVDPQSPVFDPDILGRFSISHPVILYDGELAEFAHSYVNIVGCFLKSYQFGC